MLKGIMPVLMTPMHEDGSPDHKGCIKLLDYLYQTPLPGLWALGSGGEAFNISHEHRVEFTKIVAEHVGSKTCLLVGAGSTVLPNVYRFFEDTAGMDITGYHVLPNDRKLKTAAIVDYYTQIADRSPLPIWLYSNPARMLQFPVEAVEEIAQHPNVAGMKVGGYDMSLAARLGALSSEKFQVLGAGGGNLLGYLAYGIECITMSTGSVFPQEYVEVFNLWQEGKIAEARKKSYEIAGLIGAIAPWKNTEDSAEVKAALELLGVCQRWTYPPFQPCNKQEMNKIEQALRDYGLL